MSVMAVANLFLIGTALLGLWVVARFPSFGPRSVTVSIVFVIVAFVLLSVTSGTTATMTRSEGPAAALMLVVLPTFTFAFWACARLVRAFVTMLAPFHR
jgi:uncharacterized membrane protein YczE